MNTSTTTRRAEDASNIFGHEARKKRKKEEITAQKEEEDEQEEAEEEDKKPSATTSNPSSSSSSSSTKAGQQHHVKHAPFAGPSSLLFGFPGEISRHILSFTNLGDRRHLALTSKAALGIVETFDSVAVSNFKKKHGVELDVIDSARNRIVERARKSPKSNCFDPANVSTMEFPWRCWFSVLSTEVLYEWDLQTRSIENDAQLAFSPSDRIAIFAPYRNLSVYQLNPSERFNSDNDHADDEDDDVDGGDDDDDDDDDDDYIDYHDDDDHHHDNYIRPKLCDIKWSGVGRLFFCEDLLIACSDYRLIAWSSEGKLRYDSEHNIKGNFMWAQSEDRIYGLRFAGGDDVTLHTFNALGGISLNTVNLVFDNADEMQLDCVGEIFVCGKWLVAHAGSVGLYVFDLENGCVKKSFTSLSMAHGFVQASDGPFKFCGMQEDGQVLTFYCDEESGILQQVSAFRASQGSGEVVAAFEGCSVVASNKEISICDAATGAEKAILKTGGYSSTCSVKRAHFSKHRREPVLLLDRTRNVLNWRRRGMLTVPTIRVRNTEAVVYGLTI